MNSLDLSNALPNSTTHLVFSLTPAFLGFSDGIMVPNPDLLLLGLAVDGAGFHSLPFTWPVGIPEGTQFYVQHWIVDVGGTGSSGFAASNGLKGVAQ